MRIDARALCVLIFLCACVRVPNAICVLNEYIVTNVVLRSAVKRSTSKDYIDIARYARLRGNISLHPFADQSLRRRIS